MLRDLASTTRPCAGETENGDAVFTRKTERAALLAVVDALGHGPQAAACAQAVLRCLEQTSPEQDLLDIVQQVHAGLIGTRGAALTAVLITPTRLFGCAVGNVSLKVLGLSFDVIMSPGVLGGRLRKLRVAEAARPRAARMAIFSDGVSSRFSLEPSRGFSAERACRELFVSHARNSDDATLVIADV